MQKGNFSDKDDKPVLIHCNKCRKGYMKKNISKDNKIFWGCDNYPKCKNIMSDKMDCLITLQIQKERSCSNDYI